MGIFSWLSGKRSAKEESQKQEPSSQTPTNQAPRDQPASQPVYETVTFNEPVPEEDNGVREYGAVNVAQSLLLHYAKLPLTDYSDQLFLEALWVAIDAEQELPPFKNVSRTRLAEMTQWAVNGDYANVFQQANSLPSKVKAQRLQRNVEPLLAQVHPVPVAEFLTETDQPAGFPLFKALANLSAFELIDRLLEKEPNPLAKVNILGYTLLQAMDAGHDATEREAGWAALASNDLEPTMHEAWQSWEACRLARKDSQKAQAFFQEISMEFQPEAHIQRDYYLQFAKAEEEAALEDIDGEGEIFDVLPGLIGCHQAGLDIGPKLDELFHHFSEFSYRPHAAMGWLLKAGILRNDAGFIDQVLEKGGAKGWQIAYYGGYALGELAREHSAAANALLPTLMKPRKAGFVAGRDASASLVVGTAMYKPHYLEFSKPKPVESLALYAQLAGKGPQWYTEL